MPTRLRRSRRCLPPSAAWSQRDALLVARAFAFCSALTSWSLVIRDRPGTSRRLARSIGCALDALASTPPAVLPPLRAAGPLLAAWLSEGPFSFFGSQWSPTFSNECFSESNAVRCARSPSPYCSTAESWVLPHVSCAFLGERCRVDGMSFFVVFAGTVITSPCAFPAVRATNSPGGRELEQTGSVEREVAQVDVGGLPRPEHLTEVAERK